MATSTQADQDLKVIEFNRDHFNEQKQSPLFSVLPGEIRDRIFAYALAEFEDTTDSYDNNTCYRRPEYAAPRRTDTALLRTCQRIYQEAFFYPFALAEQILWLTAAERRPPNVTTIERLEPSLALMHKLHEDTELESVRVFAQLYALEDGDELSRILDMPHFLPRTVTVTLRHTDIWFWESDEPIWIGGPWTSACRFPNSVRCINVQVESLERKKDQVDFVVTQMIDNWFFKRRDDTMLCANDNSASITRWSGSSTWEGERWLRDETRPETLDYYVATVSFRPVAKEDAKSFDPDRNLQLGPMPGARAIRHPRPNVPVYELQQANVPPGLSADEVMACFDEHRREQAARAARAVEAARQRRERQAATRSSRQAARRARAQAQVASAYPHQADVGDQPITADALKGARAARRAARDSTELIDGIGWFDDSVGESNLSRTHDTVMDDDAGEGSSAGRTA